jgi:hypothetical protein
MVAGVVGAAAFLVGVAGAIPLIWREVLEAQGKCDFAPCVNTSTAPTLVGLGLMTLIGISLLGFAARDLIHKPRIVITVARLLALIGSVVAVLSAVSGFIAGYDHPVEVAVPAIVLAIGTCVLALPSRVPAPMAGTLMAVAGLIGFGIMLQWGVNTLYYFAVPFWLLAAGLLISAGFRLSPQRAAIM